MNLRIGHTLTDWWKSWERYPTRFRLLSILWLVFISWIAFLWHLGNTGLVDETEPLFAEAARQMTVTGDWITPYFNGETRFDKPPLIYWLMAIAYKLIGVNEWAVRLPSALAGIALTSLVFYTLRRFGLSRPGAMTRAQTQEHLEEEGGTSVTSSFAAFPIIEQQRWLSAWIGAALVALNPQTLVWGRTGVSDMLLSGCMGTALLAFFLGYAQTETIPPTPKKILSFPSGWYLAFYILIALAVLTKGPVGIVLPGLIIGSFLLYLGNLRPVLREMSAVVGVGIVLVLSVPWYVLVTLANGETYIDSFFGYHNFERFTAVVNHHSAPWYFYFIVVLVGFAPWSSYLPVAIARLRFWQRDRWRSSPRSSQLGLYAGFWFASIFGFFTIAVTKLPSYVLPLIPAASILVALWWSDGITYRGKGKNRQIPFLVSGGFNVVLLLAIAVAIGISPHLIGPDPAAPNLSDLLQQSYLPVFGGIIWGITAVVTTLALVKPPGRRWVWIINFIGFVAFILVVVTPASFLLDRERQLPLRELSAIAAQVEQPGEELLMIGFEKPTVVFYTHRLVNYFDENAQAIAHIEKMGANRSQPSSFLILIESKRFNQMKKKWLKSNEYTHLGQAGAYHLIRVSKQVLAKTLQLKT